MSLKELLMEDMKQAMRDKDMVRKNTIQFLRSAILQVEKDTLTQLSDQEIIEVISSQVKKRRASLPDFEKSGRNDLIEELNHEISILMSYLPEQLSEEQLDVLISATIAEISASSLKDMGKVMAALLPKVSGKADNGLVSRIVKSKLSQ